ncbi:MAG: DUF1553 domain-containing protein [Planctomycetaceae bacterium]|nr:DUF1553 domain-containing protein [Planctomycetaceae bacterium]
MGLMTTVAGRIFVCLVLASIWTAPFGLARTTLASPQDFSDTTAIEFFENRIRPVLVEHCYECHNSHDAREGGLALDHRQALLAGGDSGPVLDLQQPRESRLLRSIRHQLEGLEMPQGRSKLAESIGNDFEHWIASGAVDPRLEPPTASEHAASTAWPEIQQRRLKWWAFQPIRSSNVALDSARTHPIDYWINAQLESQNLRPGPRASANLLVRRLFQVLIGLPPTVEQAQYWTTQLQQPTEVQQQREFERLVDELLASPHFGERWARHWMDWIRYAESHGSEGDPTLINAYHYRDYLIRSLNQDVPYDQLVREHVAGDLLEAPRINHELGLNESRIATAHWRMVFHGFSPTDALDEQVRFIDDQINVFSKAFLGLTVSCARCHDHKFDPIGQDDYYALYGILRSNRAGRQVINQTTTALGEQLTHLTRLKDEIRAAIVQEWLADQASLEDRLRALAASTSPESEKLSGFGLLFRAVRAEREGRSLVDFWREEQQKLAEDQQAARAEHSSSQEIESWHSNSPELPTTRQPAGQFAIATNVDRVLVGIYPAGIYSHGLSDKLAARLTSKNIELRSPQELWLQVIGDREPSLRYSVRDYPRDGTIYPLVRLNGQTWQWQRFDLAYWTGDLIHIELAHAQDAPLLLAGQERSWFGVRSARLVPVGSAAPRVWDEASAFVLNWDGAEAPATILELVKRYQAAILDSIQQWDKGALTDAQALLLDAALRQALLVNDPSLLPKVRDSLRAYQDLEAEIETPIRVPGLVEAEVADQPLFVRGDHRRPGELIPRRFLSAIDATPYDKHTSGRRQLAEDLLREDNPLTRRVIVNRLWHHLFGRGLVATPDNFGKLGSEPTHAELLDWMADRFAAEHDWSLKKMIRQIVTSQTWQRDSRLEETGGQQDPEQIYLARFPIRRFEAETIRDSVLQAAGTLDLQRFGASEMDVMHQRRAIYSAVRRNSLVPFLRLFDFPEPSTSVGRRDVTTVPAQSLTMFNDPFVRQASDRLGEELWQLASKTNDQTALVELYWRCFSRAPVESEINTGLRYLQQVQRVHHEARQQMAAVQQRRSLITREMQALLDPIQERLKQETNAGSSPLAAEALPRARWSFAHGTSDLVGSAQGTLEGTAVVRDGALQLNGDGYLVSLPLTQDVTAKTFEAWVQLSDLSQQGGGVISLQTRDGNVFDSLVFGEQQPGHWMAGSDVFNRTQSFAGSTETEAANRMVHVALAYDADGMIRAYRDGRPYGTPYRSTGPIRFVANDAVVTLGLRHLPSGGNRWLRGQVFDARLYDRALTDAEIKSSFEHGIQRVTWAQVLAELEPAQRTQVETWQAELLELQQQAQSIAPESAGLEPASAWSELVHAMFMSVEFTTIR